MSTLAIPQSSPTERGRKFAVTKSPSFLTTTFAGNTLHGGSAEVISNQVRSNRTCTIQISNHLNVPLTDPQFYCYDGQLYYPLPPAIQPGTREACVFSKDPTLPHGVIGVLTYQIGDTPKRLVIMFSVAYNQLQYRNHFGTAILEGEDLELGMGEDGLALLFERMYLDMAFYRRIGRSHNLANDGVPMLTGDGSFQVRGTMTDRGKAIIKMNISA